MIFDPKKHRIFFYNDYVDMRKGHSSLSMIISRKTKFEIMDGTLFILVSKNRRTLKGLFFDGSGLCLLHKKIDSGNFMATDFFKNPFELFESDFKIIIHGGRVPVSKKGQRIKLQLK